MNRHDFQVLAGLRVKEARVLLDNQCFAGAYYLVGYAVECALKACIAKQTRRFDFPSRTIVNSSYTHDLEKLLIVSGLKRNHEQAIQASPQFQINWTITKDWSEEMRYSTAISRTQADELYSAVTARRNGVLSWVKTWW